MQQMKLCDTSVLVDIDRGGINDKVRSLDAEGRHAISTVTVTELRIGVEFQYQPGTDAYRRALDDLDRLLARFEIVPVSRSVAVSASRILGTLRRRGLALDDLHDCYIGATARTEERPVLTSNVDHFERMPDVDVVDWESY